MTVVALPSAPVAAKIKWTLKQPTQSNRGEFSGLRRVTVLSAAPRWMAEVEYPTIMGERAIQPWRAAMALLQGQANSFKLVACECPQVKISIAVVVHGAGQTGNTLVTRGWQPGEYLRAGMFVSVGGRLLQVTARTDLAGSDGHVTITVMPAIPGGLADGAPVEVRLPFGLMAMTDDSAGWTVDRGQQYSIEFACEEAF